MQLFQRYICRVCQFGELVLLEKRLDIDMEVNDIYICRNCFVVSNLSHKCEENVNVSLQREGSLNFYQYTDDECKAIEFLVEANKDILRAIVPYLGRVDNKVLLEIGSGRGLLLVAASELGFGKAIGVDYNTASFVETKKLVQVRDNVHLYSCVESVPTDVKADCLIMWHTLEHILEPNRLFESLDKRLDGGYFLFIQVPQYKQSYLCKTHYYFYNEPSIRLLLNNNGFHIIRIEYDMKLQFMTVIAKKVGHLQTLFMQKRGHRRRLVV